ncbi:CDGSH iron-sulfur domain-containing protein 2 homolog isoform X2 [Diaphorina citri]|uniref:CDGSH iron-sulfur domain-containing protein 2 homologue n=1 Tax=Diaphorina citri TaxID=121845 RepID=A0A3Q0JNL0_DIACI|nr:CDGSH iron-sulfur domain-containing protein 2 homolog isoform X2 [Diaphorina citri]
MLHQKQMLINATSLLIVIYLSLCWGKLEDYEFQEIDPPVMTKPRFTLPPGLAERFAEGIRKKVDARVNKHLYKSEDVVTNRFTVFPSDPPLVLCRCWESKKFPLCDGAHRAHNERNKDNIGPAIISASNKHNLYMNDTSGNETNVAHANENWDSDDKKKK